MEIATSRSALWALRLFFGSAVLFLYAPLLVLAVFSFNDGTTVAFPLEGFTTRWYQGFLSNQLLLRSLRTSFVVAASSSVIAVALGVATAYLLSRRRFRGRAALSALVISPLVIPYLVFGISLLVLFTTVDKVLKETLGVYIGLGLHAIVIGHVVVSLPYTVLTVLPRLQRLDVSIEEAARDLGATGPQTFRRITLPLLRPAIVSAFLIAFTLSFDEYAIASFLVGTESTWPVFLFSQLRREQLLPQLIAVSVLVLTVSMLLVVGTEAFRARAERRLGA
jgi:spermidine/putrescine transport system permease protein